jgi:hypothetical protein
MVRDDALVGRLVGRHRGCIERKATRCVKLVVDNAAAYSRRPAKRTDRKGWAKKTIFPASI